MLGECCPQAQTSLQSKVCSIVCEEAAHWRRQALPKTSLHRTTNPELSSGPPPAGACPVAEHHLLHGCSAECLNKRKASSYGCPAKCISVRSDLIPLGRGLNQPAASCTPEFEHCMRQISATHVFALLDGDPVDSGHWLHAKLLHGLARLLFTTALLALGAVLCRRASSARDSGS